MPEFTGVSHIELTVRDVDRSATWYEQILGLLRLGEFPEYRTPGVSARVDQVMHRATGLTIGLIQHELGEESEFSEFRVGLDHLAFAVESRDELERWVEHLDDHGVPHSAIHDMPYGWVVVLRDPDNIQLELFAVAPNLGLDLG
jgi:catechol 2,3-dioxygenase-like lactoylglutathione lyase family enzyme